VGITPLTNGLSPINLRVMGSETLSEKLVADVDAFLKRIDSEMTETTFGRLAVNDGKFVPRLRAGGRMWPETEQKVRDFMADFLSDRAPTAPRRKASRERVRAA
jgi:hypothetical protein